MRHDWIFDVLKDLKSYALRHDLPALAAQADLALRVARAEIDAAGAQESPPRRRGDDGCDEEDDNHTIPPRSGRRH
jgi:hypothetical protein